MSDQGFGGFGRGRGPDGEAPMADDEEIRIPVDRTAAARFVSESDLADLREAVRADLTALNERLMGMETAVGQIHERLNALETSVGQLTVQMPTHEQELLNHRNVFAAIDARMNAIAQTISKNWRYAACEAAAKARGPGDTSKQILELAIAFHSFIEPPPPPPPPEEIPGSTPAELPPTKH